MIKAFEQIKCPYCGTFAKQDVHTKRFVCKCRRMHGRIDINGNKYIVLFNKDGTKEVIK